MPDDTWGITGPQFLALYLGLLVVFVLLAFVVRRTSIGGVADRAGRLPSPAEAALLAAGPGRVVHATVAALRANGALGTGTDGTVGATGPLPSEASRLEGAVYEAVRRGVPARDLAADPLVASAVSEITASGTSAGWLLDGGQRSLARFGGFLLAGLAVFGAARIAAGMGNDRPVGSMAFLTVVAFGLALGFLLAVPRVSRAGKAALVELRSRHGYLRPDQDPAWSTYGANTIALGVALFGTAAVWSADPTFASAAGLPAREEGSALGDGGGYYSGGGDGGGSGCGGDGGGCGGGGCGG